MDSTQLEQRVARLEQRVEELSTLSPSVAPSVKDWRRTVGMFRGDPIMKTINDEANRLRESERAVAHDQERREGP
jgi:hypothetical protein